MIVQDNVNELNMLKEYVEQVYPIDRLVTCENSKDAFELAQSEKFDVCFTDIEMQPVSGFKLLEALKERNRRIAINLISKSDSYIMEAWKAHVNDYLVKPVTKDDVCHTLAGIRT